MEKLKVSLSKYNGEGACAHIENHEGDDLMIYVAPWDADPVEACKAVASVLRNTAEQFEKLATMKKPFHEATQKKVNR